MCRENGRRALTFDGADQMAKVVFILREPLDRDVCETPIDGMFVDASSGLHLTNERLHVVWKKVLCLFTHPVEKAWT